MKAIAIDDEPLALGIIEAFCRRIGDIEVQTFSNPLEGIEQVQQTVPDILFLDIEMGDIKGINLAPMMPPQCHLVFTTAYAEFALEGFNLNAIDYLQKPFSFERFCRAVNKVRELQTLRSDAALTRWEENIITLKVDYHNQQVRLGEICYIVAMENYVRIFLADGSNVVSQITMKAAHEMLPPSQFLRIHKSYIVSKRHISAFNRTQVTLGDTTLPVGRAYADSFVQQM